MPWLAVFHLYHTASVHEKRAIELEKKIAEQSDHCEEVAVIYSGNALMYAAKVERSLDDFEAATSQEHDDIWKAMGLLQKQLKKGK